MNEINPMSKTKGGWGTEPESNGYYFHGTKEIVKQIGAMAQKKE